MTDRRKSSLSSRKPQTTSAAVSSIAAGASTGWCSSTAFVVLGLITIAAFVIVVKTPQARLGVIVTCALASSIAVRLPELDLEAVVLGLVWGLVVVLIIGGSLTIRRVLEQHQAFQQRGWEIAALEAERRASETREALRKERMSLAAEMHDGLGHTLTLIAVRLGQMSVSPSLATTDRQNVTEVRQIAADAADELGLAVRLLRTSDEATTEWAVPTVESIIDGARKADIDVTTEIPDGFSDSLSDEVETAIIRVVQEGLTNAAKHAPGRPVTIHIVPAEDEIRVVIRNELSDTQTEAHEGGFGLAGLQYRAEMLGGELTTDQSSTDYTLRLTLPRRARPVAPVRDDVEEIRDTRTAIAEHRSKAARLAVALPVAVVSIMVLVMTAYFVVVNMFSVMTTAEFQAIEVGEERVITEQVLPQFEMFDPPRDEFPARANEECFYYESGVSFFERRDVFVICISADQVSRNGTVPAQ